ncbi:uncharacterized protein LOC115620614 isoform X2 [Scaptodrosophila lebanonensis]|uniref:Uncharacterized protein LOC115620614 isoform X2 n=1 Tax=Drosophila lebanonensis TaxID=7225 RepID=A0A6J2T3E0_DROLE|nr:uncharacterized protein LOC115620614 isoform X2 [Scaptodrosophila lebanonensis]
MSSSVFTEIPSGRSAADGDSNLVVVYSKHGITFDNRGIEKIMEEKSISTISVVRLTSPTPSMVDEEEAERLEELKHYLETGSDRDDSDRDTDIASRSGCEDEKSEKEHLTGDDNDDNSVDQDHDDSTETEVEAAKAKKRPGRKPKVIKKQKKRRKLKERPQIVGLSVEQFYTDSNADLVVKNALKIAGLSIFKRTAETDALLEIIRNDHNYTPFTSPEQMKAHKNAEKLDAERQQIHGKKFIVQAPAHLKMQSSKKRIQVVPFSQVQTAVQQKFERKMIIENPGLRIMRNIRPIAKTCKLATDNIEDNEDAHTSVNADDENVDAEKSYDSEDIEPVSEQSEESRDTDNDRDSDIDFKMNYSRNSTKRRRVKKLTRRTNVTTARSAAVVHKPLSQHFPHIKRRKLMQDESCYADRPKTILQTTRVSVGRPANTQYPKTPNSTKSSPTISSNSKQLTPEAPRMASPSPITSATPRMRRTPVVQVGAMAKTTGSGSLLTPPQEVKEIIINKKLTSPKGVFTNLNTLLTDSIETECVPRPVKQRLLLGSTGPYNTAITTAVASRSSTISAQSSSKGFMPIEVNTASSHKLPAQIVIETHQSSSELAAEHNQQLDLINSIVQDELLKADSVMEKQPTSADESIPKIVKMLENTVAGLDQAMAPNSNKGASFEDPTTNDCQNIGVIDDIATPLLATPDEDEITADFLQHVVGLIEEDKQFEAEVVKQVLASADSGNLNIGGTIDTIESVAALPSNPSIFNAERPLTQVSMNQPPAFGTNVMSTDHQPIACSTPSRVIAPQAGTTPINSETKIVRGNGRVIYLPPIEAPTTRAKRRAQNISTDLSNISILPCESNRVNSQIKSTSFDNESFVAQSTATTSNVSGIRYAPKEDIVNTRMMSGRPVSSRSSKQSTGQANDTEASESQEDDDDPNKLWCICRQPHNNRFMICCDLCEDWYHGTCVSVTKAMGLDMEQKGIDWKCPKCVRVQEEKTQPRITDMLLNRQPMDETQKDSHLKSKESVDITNQPTEVKCVPQLIKQSSMSTLLEPGSNAPSKRRLLPVAPVKLDVLTPQQAIASRELGNANDKQHGQMLAMKLKVSDKMQQQKLNFPKLSCKMSDTLESSCIVCKRPSRSNSIYCSDECIRKYAQSAIQTQNVTKSPETIHSSVMVPAGLDVKKNKKKNLFEDMLRQADSLSKVERINVFERKTGRVICGQNAPTVHQLKKWLQENPTFEVVQPGSIEAKKIEKRQQNRLDQSSNGPSFIQKSNCVVVTAQSHTPTRQSEAVKSSQTLLTSRTSSSPKTVISEMRSVERKDKNNTKTRDFSNTPRRTAERDIDISKPEPIRINVRRTLMEQLVSRIKEAQAMDAQSAMSSTPREWLTVEEVESFANSVELEMYNSFNRDVGAKYKSKYRSLMFNIKDRKNKTLFEKICAKQIEPKQLVKMTPEELASQELAKWREEENRHQLDMIKKSELDMIACSKNYMVKTHKGEEIIETKLNVTLPDENQVEMDSFEVTRSQPSEIRSSNEKDYMVGPDTEGTSSAEKNSALGKDAEKEKHNKVRPKSSERDRERNKERKKHKSHKRSHHQSNKRSRSRSSSRGQSVEMRHKTAPRREDHQDGDHKKAKDQNILNENHEYPEVIEKREKSPLRRIITEKKQEEASPKPPIYNLVDQILESEKTVEQAANLVESSKAPNKVGPPVFTTIPTASNLSTNPHPDKYSRYMQGHPSRALWSGRLNMVDVADFHIVIHPVNGNSQQLVNRFPPNLEVIGRITSENVWDYLKKIKKSPTKEIVTVGLFPSSPSEVDSFKHFFQYLNSRQRLGVLGADPEEIRDFYIYPLGERDKVPSVLRTADHEPFYDKDHRPNTLLGIIVRCIGKRPGLLNSSPQTLPTSSAISKQVKLPHKPRATINTTPPPNSPKRKRSRHSTSSKDDEFDIDAIIKAPIVAKTKKINTDLSASVELGQEDPNEPYSPGGSSDDDLPATTTNKYDLKRKVEEINKQIAAQQIEIAGLLHSAEPPVLETSNVLAGISIPPNLSSILARIKDKSEVVVKEMPTSDDIYNPESTISSNSSYTLEQARKSTSRLAQLSEAELLSMVPDDLIDVAPKSSTRYEEPPPPGV